MKHKSVIEIDYSELETLVKKHLGFKKYDFVSTEECGNDSSHEFSVDGKIAEFEKEYIQKWREGKTPSYTNSVVINELARLGHIEKGDYIVTVCW